MIVVKVISTFLVMLVTVYKDCKTDSEDHDHLAMSMALGRQENVVHRLKRDVIYKQNTSKRQFSYEEKVNIVNTHNALRATVSPSAANMLYMVT